MVQEHVSGSVIRECNPDIEHICICAHMSVCRYVYVFVDQHVLICVCTCVCARVHVCMCVFVGSCLATKVFIGNLPAMGRGWVIIK